MQSIIADTGPLAALYRVRDRDHIRTKLFLQKTKARLLTTLPVVTEVCHFLSTQGKLGFLTWVRRGGLVVYTITADDLEPIATIIKRYADREMDFADASLIWLADRTNVRQVMTLDRTDFAVYRLSKGLAFDVVFQ